MSKKIKIDPTIKLLIKRNLMEVVDIDKASSYINDPDFGLIENESSWDSSSFTSFVRKKNTFSYVIYEKTKIVGFLLVESDPDSTKIEKLTVHPKYRRLTFGSLLLNHLIQKAFSPKIVVYCKENDSDSIAFYKSKKFKSNLAKSHFGKAIDAVRFSLEIK